MQLPNYIGCELGAGLTVQRVCLIKPIELFDAGVRAEVEGTQHREDVGVVAGEKS